MGAQETVASPLTRAGALALIVEGDPQLRARAAAFAKRMPPLPLFYDVGSTAWYGPYVEAAFEAGIVTGNAERMFRPADFLTSEEAVQLANRVKSHLDPNAPIVIALPGRVYSSWFSEALTTAGIYKITLPERVRLGQAVDRGEFFAMIGSAGIANPETIALTVVSPAPTVVAAQPPAVPVAASVVATTYGRPAYVAPTRPQQPAVVAVTQPTQQPSRPAVQQPGRTQPVAQQPVRITAPVQPPARVTTPTPTVIASNKAFAISIPTVGIKDLSIIHPSDPLTSKGLLAPLAAGVGHLFSYPGKGGKILVYGHSSSYPWDVSAYTKIFRQINKLNVGDKIYVTYNGSMHTYQVTRESVVPASDMSAYRGGGGEELILYTCWPPDDIKQRYLVHAKPVETVAVK